MNETSYIVDVKAKVNGLMDDAVRFVVEKQLKDRALWKKFTEVYTTREDSKAGRWRGEYFGKQILKLLEYKGKREKQINEKVYKRSGKHNEALRKLFGNGFRRYFAKRQNNHC